MKNVLITGGAGYLGCVLAQKLLERGYFVRILDPLLFGKGAVKFLSDWSSFDFQVGVTEDKYMLKKCLANVDCVIHLSGLSNDPSCEINADLTRKANVDATRVLLDLSRKSGVKRLIYASSCSVYGFVDGDETVDENSPLNPLTAYAQSKVDSEKLLLPEANDDFVIVGLRQSTLFGPSERMRFDLVVNTMTGMAVQENKIVINGGHQWRPFLHVADSADAFAFMLEADKEKVNGHIFNVGSNDNNLKIIDLAQRIAKVLPGVNVETSPGSDYRSYHVKFDKINNLGWKAQKSIEDGVLGVKRIFDDNPKLDFRDINHFNIKRMISYLNI